MGATSRVATVHFALAIVCSLPVIAWTASGLGFALPRPAGPKYEVLEMARVKIDAPAAVAAASQFAGRPLAVSSLTLEQRSGSLSWIVVAGGAGVRVDAESGQARQLEPKSGSSWMNSAHFFTFAGAWRQGLQIAACVLILALTASGIVLIGLRLRRV